MHFEKRILVTGEAGFLGSHLCDRLISQRSAGALRGQFLYEQAQERRVASSPQIFRVDSPRRDFPVLCGGG